MGADTLTRRRRPPYARELAAALAAGRHQGRVGASIDGTAATLWVVAGSDAWAAAAAHRDRALLLVAPPGEDPAAYDWAQLVGHDPIVIHRAGDIDGAAVHALAAAMMVDGVDVVLDPATGARYVALVAA